MGETRLSHADGELDRQLHGGAHPCIDRSRAGKTGTHDTPDREQQHKDRAGRVIHALPVEAFVEPAPSVSSIDRTTAISSPERDVDGIRKRRARWDAPIAEHDATGSKRRSDARR
jgi:hypothetical protein